MPGEFTVQNSRQILSPIPSPTAWDEQDQLPALNRDQREMMLARNQQASTGKEGRKTEKEHKASEENMIKYIFSEYKHVQEEDKEYGGEFCQAVFKAVGRTPTFSEWKHYRTRALNAIRNRKSTVSTEIGTKFKRKLKLTGTATLTTAI